MPSFVGTVADAAVVALQSAAVQTALLTAVTAGEADIKTLVDGAVSNAKAGGILGTVIAVSKGSFEAEFDAELAKLTPTEIVAWITAQAVAEAKRLGG